MSLETSEYGVLLALRHIRLVLDCADLAMVNRQLPREHVKEILRLASTLEAAFVAEDNGALPLPEAQADEVGP